MDHVAEIDDGRDRPPAEIGRVGGRRADDDVVVVGVVMDDALLEGIELRPESRVEAPEERLEEVPAAGRLFTQYPENRVYPPGSTDDNKAYLMLSGTSMATPVVSATVALMLEANPSLTPNAVKAILAYTAQRMTAPNVLEAGKRLS